MITISECSRLAVLDVGPDEHGLAMRDPARGTVFIGVARTRNPMRQRSTLAHELGHVLLGHWADADAGNWGDWMTQRTPQLAARFGWSDQYQALQDDSNRRRAPQRLLARAAMRDTYQRLRGLDGGLPPIEKTRLLSHELWP